jgi:hypothetical protein
MAYLIEKENLVGHLNDVLRGVNDPVIAFGVLDC